MITADNFSTYFRMFRELDKVRVYIEIFTEDGIREVFFFGTFKFFDNYPTALENEITRISFFIEQTFKHNKEIKGVEIAPYKKPHIKEDDLHIKTPEEFDKYMKKVLNNLIIEKLVREV